MRYKKLGATFAAAVILLSGCASSSNASDSTDASDKDAVVEKVTEVYKPMAEKEAGDGTFELYTAGGNTENGNIPKIKSGSSASSIDIDTRGMDGSIMKIYIDGQEILEDNFGDKQQSIQLSPEAQSVGVHIVELVGQDKNEMYKIQRYEIVE